MARQVTMGKPESSTVELVQKFLQAQIDREQRQKGKDIELRIIIHSHNFHCKVRKIAHLWREHVKFPTSPEVTKPSGIRRNRKRTGSPLVPKA